MSVSGILDVKTVQGTSNGETFYDFVQTHLLPHLMPYNGVNPHSVVVLDNCAIHHVAEVTAIFEEVGVLLHFLPPYSPDLNPIEEAFSKLKSILKTEIEGMTDVEALILSSFITISADDCKGWIFVLVFTTNFETPLIVISPVWCTLNLYHVIHIFGYCHLLMFATLTLASFPGSPALIHRYCIHKMFDVQKAGEEPGNKATQVHVWWISL